MGLTALVGVLALSAASLCAGPQTTLPQQFPPQPGGARPFPGGDAPGLPADVQHKLDRAQRESRRKDLVKATSRMLQISAQVQRDLREHGTLTDDDRHLLDEMVKLARTVKEREKE